ncbi:tripartite tricarboxylate transporter substrate-binding protein [Bordetella genomosp. 13]|uniref:tripartite tricarboxylate transporter substrate-binding protein n=1 Tax=Bordetella genomosp. 13 TaxID=463040 RepID=UPI0011A8F749|nr:tripartite tricarboxylate transporter substrate-binding protein [Bordetella genomosp. 13]
MIDRRTFMGACCALASTATFAGPAGPAPLRSARILCGFPPGGSADMLARRIGEYLQGKYADSVVVENKTGAAGRIAIEECKRSAPDGSTLLLTPASTILLFPFLYKDITYGSEDFTSVSTVAWIQSLFGIGPAVPGTVQDLPSYLEWARAHPADANYATPGTGSMPHVLSLLLARQSGTPLQHIPYRGSAPAVVDLLGGQVSAYCGPVGDLLPHMKSGKLRLLATSGQSRSALTSGVPTFAQCGFPDLVMSQWQGVFMPRNVPLQRVRVAADLITEAVRTTAFATALEQMSMEPGGSTPAETLAFVQRDKARWKATVNTLQIELEQ